MGEGSKRGAARGDGLNACEANDPGSRKKEYRRCRTSRLVSLMTKLGTWKGGRRVQTPHHVSDDRFVVDKDLLLMNTWDTSRYIVDFADKPW